MIYITGIISLVIQFIVGILGYFAMKIEISSKDELLKDLLEVELIVQAVEFIFYLWLIYYLYKTSRNITPFRYLDWSITTPLMLITLSAYLKHNENIPMRLTDFLSDNTYAIVKIIVLNTAMLLFGFIGEIGLLNPYISTALGFIPFALNFKYINDTFLQSSEDIYKKILFYWFVFFWSLYGIFALTKYTIKNAGYNILDIFSKNLFGVFLAYSILLKSKS